MNKPLRHILLLVLALAACALPAKAQLEPDDSDEQIRLAPELGANRHVPQSGYAAYPFINLSANSIAMNGADWGPLRQLFTNSGDTVISIVHIGDSHIQAEGSTTRTRSNLQSHYGSAGRGLITPFRVAGTNQPLDYKITSPSAFATAKLMKRPWAVDVGFTGIALQPSQRRFSFTISTERREGSEPDFDIVRMHTSGHMPRLLYITDADGTRIKSSHFSSPGVMDIFIYESLTEATFYFESQGKCQIYGFQLENQMTGVEYSAIGNNGATYSSYSGIPGFAAGVASLDPALIIVSLGTNEAFGRTTKEMLRQSMAHLIGELRRECPNAMLLLTTPAECKRSRTSYTGKGKRRRRSKTYVVNDNVVLMREAILEFGADRGIPVYDFYRVAGGKGSATLWHEHELMGKDQIHYTWTGYDLIGSLLFDALQAEISKPSTSQSR